MVSELHRRVSDAIRPVLADEVYQSARIADAVIAALGLEEQRSLGIESGSTWENLRNYRRRRYVTPWERIEEDG